MVVKIDGNLFKIDGNFCSKKQRRKALPKTRQDMKKLLLIIVLIIATAAIAAAQNDNHSQRDVIFLKSGSTVKGQVIDKKDDGSVRVRTGDGHVYHFDGKEVQRIEKETPRANNNNQQQQNDYQQPSGNNRNKHGKQGKHNRANNYEHNNPAAQNKTVTQQNQYQSRQSDRRQTFKNKQKKDKLPATYAEEGYRWFVEAGFLPGVTCSDGYDQEFTSRAMLATSHGYQLSAHTFVGGGIGAHYFLHRKEIAVTPFVDFRYDFFADLNSPFVGARAGGYIHQGGSGGFFNAMVGYHFGRVSLTAGYEIAPYKYRTTTNKDFCEESKYYSSFLLKISMDWGGR